MSGVFNIYMTYYVVSLSLCVYHTPYFLCLIILSFNFLKNIP